MASKKPRGWLAVWLGSLLTACGGGAAPPAAAPAERAEPGRSAEAPALTCGPAESYAYVASRFRCADGSNPLGGTAPRPHSSHVLDIYDVPCPGGAVPVYVDMYGCREYEEQLRQSEEGSEAGNALKARFRGGDYPGVLARCQELTKEAPADERTWCMVLAPAALYAQQRAEASLSAVDEVCSRMHVASASSDARAQYLALTTLAFGSLMHEGKIELTDEQRGALMESWLRACEVPSAQLEQVLESMNAE